MKIPQIVIRSTVISTIFAVSFIVSAPYVESASVKVYPTIENAHGGDKYARDMKTELFFNGVSIGAEYGVPTYVLPGSGSYEVKFHLLPGYSATTTNPYCAGTIAADEDLTCAVFYRDGAPIVIPEPSPVQEPTPTPTPTPAPIEPIEPTPIVVPDGFTAIAPAPTSTTIIQTVVVREIVQAPPPTVLYVKQDATTTDATTTKQIADLQTRVGVLERIVDAIVAFLKGLFRF